jgi:hypothetical protein
MSPPLADALRRRSLVSPSKDPREVLRNVRARWGAGVVVRVQEPFGGHRVHCPPGCFRRELLPHQPCLRLQGSCTCPTAGPTILRAARPRGCPRRSGFGPSRSWPRACWSAPWTLVPAAWVTADEAYGGDPVLRGWLEDREVSYFLAVRCTDPEALPVVEHGFLTDRDGHDVSVLVDGSGWRVGWPAPRPCPGSARASSRPVRTSETASSGRMPAGGWGALASGRYLQDGAGDRRGRGG